MTRLPSMDLYNDAVQAPRSAFKDPELAGGEVVKNGLGLPKPASGGFALTYGVKSGSKTYAVRLFHRHSPGLELRYKQISVALAHTPSPYFVGFEFQPDGIVVQGGRFPVVKMAWAAGEVLGGWVKRNRSSKASMLDLRNQFRLLSEQLESRGIAHGDIQGGNVMVDVGPKIRLIDYDGMWVPPMKQGDGEELGHIHFQHPRRERGSFGPKIDRFSFIVLELTLSALAEHSRLFDDFNTGENLVLQRTDYLAPHQSKAFERLRQIPALKEQVDSFERICLASIDQVPSLADFLKGMNIPAAAARPIKAAAPVAVVYRGPNEVLDASDFDAAERMVGYRVELIGRVSEVAARKTRHRWPYVFVNFGPWQGEIVKIIIWSEALDTFGKPPDSSWAGRWVSVNGLVEPPFSKSDHGYTHIGVEIEDESEIRFITEDEALFRLGRRNRTTAGSSVSSTGDKNRDLIKGIRNGTTGPLTTGVTSSTPGRGTAGHKSRVVNTGVTHSSPTKGSRSSNQDLVDRMGALGQPSPAGTGSVVGGSLAGGTGRPSKSAGSGNGWIGCLIPLVVIAAIFILPQFCSKPKSRSANRRTSQLSPGLSESSLAQKSAQIRALDEATQRALEKLASELSARQNSVRAPVNLASPTRRDLDATLRLFDAKRNTPGLVPFRATLPPSTTRPK